MFNKKVFKVVMKMVSVLNLEDFIVLVEAMFDELGLLQLDGGITVVGPIGCVKLYYDSDKDVWLPHAFKDIYRDEVKVKPKPELIEHWAKAIQHNWKRLQEEPELFQYIIEKVEKAEANMVSA